MKRLRLERWAGQLAQGHAQARCKAHAPSRAAINGRSHPTLVPVRHQTTSALQYDSSTPPSSAISTTSENSNFVSEVENSRSPYPSPLPEEALKSAKLAALHARLCLPKKVPLQTLARTLVDASADENPAFNNASLAYTGGTIINYHTSELLIMKYPRLPMSVLFEAMRGYAGNESLAQVAKGWGVEAAAAPGGEVDPGLLQFSTDPTKGTKKSALGYVRTEASYLDKFKWRRGWSSRVVLDDAFGDTVHENTHKEPRDEAKMLPREVMAERKKVRDAIHNAAFASFAKALVGAIYAHCGREVAKSFVGAHVLSRNLEVDKMFKFHAPLMELARLCAREGFERPVARLESETGRLSRTPVYVVGIYSGKDKLGEGVGASLDFARWKAAMSSLKAWYLYSPAAEPRVPSDMLVEGAKPWKAPYIDIGEVSI